MLHGAPSPRAAQKLTTAKHCSIITYYNRPEPVNGSAFLSKVGNNTKLKPLCNVGRKKKLSMVFVIHEHSLYPIRAVEHRPVELEPTVFGSNKKGLGG